MIISSIMLMSDGNNDAEVLGIIFEIEYIYL